MALELDKIDRRILLELDRNARIPDTRLAKIVGRSKESVRYRIKKLQDLGVIQGYYIWIDPTKLGRPSAKIYLNLANVPSKKAEFIDYVRKDKRVMWLGIADGAWNAGITYFVKDTREFFELKNDLFSKFKDLILENHTAMLVSIYIKDRVFLTGQKCDWSPIFDVVVDNQIDDADKKIMKELFADARVNLVEIARRHKLTVDIVRGRMKKLEEIGVIRKYRAKINFNKLGYEFYKSFLYFKNLNKKDLVRLKEYTQQDSRIIHFVEQISPWDVELETMCKNYHEYNEMISDLTKEFSDVVRKVETAIMGEDYVFPAEKMIFED